MSYVTSSHVICRAMHTTHVYVYIYIHVCVCVCVVVCMSEACKSLHSHISLHNACICIHMSYVTSSYVICHIISLQVSPLSYLSLGVCVLGAQHVQAHALCVCLGFGPTRDYASGPSPTLLPTDPVPWGLLTLWARAEP